MEKLVYIVWKPEGASDASFAQILLQKVAPELQRLGAHRLRASVVDDDVSSGQALRRGVMDHAKSGMVSFWLEQAQERGPLEAVIAGSVSRYAAYLVLESRCLVKPPDLAPAGQRTPGFSLVTCIEPKDGISYDTFIDKWHRVQRDTAIETQSTFSYIRNEIVRALTPDAPKWAAVVEEGFPIGALTDPMVFYDAGGSQEIFDKNVERMMASVEAFLAMDRVESHPMSEYDFEG